MERPESILWFERLYLGSVAIGLINASLNWSTMKAQAEAVPNAAILPSWFLGATVAIGIVINLLLWYFIARRRSVVAKWIVTVLLVIGLPGLANLYSGVQAGIMSPLMASIAVLLFLLQAVAVAMLFRADAKPWFDKSRSDLGETFS